MDEGLIKIVILLLVGAFVLISKLVGAAQAYRKHTIARRAREELPPFQAPPVMEPALAPVLAPPAPARPPRRPPRRKHRATPTAHVVTKPAAVSRAAIVRPARRLPLQALRGDSARLREAIVLREVLGPPKALRNSRRFR